MRDTPSNSDDLIDSRDVIARIEELKSELETWHDENSAPHAILEHSDELQEMESELETLEALAEEAEGYCPDWRHGAQLIRDSYFKEYAEQLAYDIGAVDKHANWPNSYIDWEAAALALQQDYTSVSFDGVDYWVR